MDIIVYRGSISWTPTDHRLLCLLLYLDTPYLLYKYPFADVPFSKVFFTLEKVFPEQNFGKVFFTFPKVLTVYRTPKTDYTRAPYTFIPYTSIPTRTTKRIFKRFLILKWCVVFRETLFLRKISGHGLKMVMVSDTFISVRPNYNLQNKNNIPFMGK